MGKYEDRVERHAVHASLSQVLAALDALSDEQIAPVADDKSRLEWVLNHFRDRVATAPAVAVPQSVLDQGASHVQAIAAAVATYRDGGDAAQMIAANSNADAILEALRALPPLASDSRLRGLASEIAEVRKSIGAVAGIAKKESTALVTASQRAQTELEATRSEFTAKVDALEQQAQVISTDLVARTTELEALTTNQTQAFQAGETSRASQFAEVEAARTLNNGDRVAANGKVQYL